MAPSRPRRRLLLIPVLFLLVLAGAAVRPAAAQDAATTGLRAVDLTASDGVVLKAHVIEPAGTGRHPAIVLINSWGVDDREYTLQANTLAGQGYVVLAYTTRGFWNSGGRIETAGPPDIADAATAVDWLLAHTSADPGRIGMGGVSYGSGISLIAAAFDPRIKAVVAGSSWADLVASLYGADTRRPQAVFLLAALANLVGRPSAELSRVIDDYFANRNVAQNKEFGRIRSATSYVDAINRNHPAILLANAYGDSLFPPNSLIDFYGRLTGPKRLELAAGDHAVVEATGLVGLDNRFWTSLYRWFGRYLAGADTGIDREPPVVLRVRNTTGAVDASGDWAAVTASTTRLGLGPVRWWDGTGPLGGAPTTGWSRTIWTGLDTTAGAGVAILSNGFEALSGVPPTVWLPSVDRLHAGVWVGEPLPAAAPVRGIARLHLSVRPAGATGTVVAYLYDLDATGTGELVTHAPASWLAATPGAPTAVDVELSAMAYDVPAGHRLALVVDTADPLYLDANPPAAAITFDGPSYLDIPLG
jgi:predicted acyl esterase